MSRRLRISATCCLPFLDHFPKTSPHNAVNIDWRRYFFDASALVKYYHAEAGTPRVNAIFSELGRRIRISSLGLIEMQSVFAMKVRSGILDRQVAAHCRARLMLDIAAGILESHTITDEHFGEAERLIGRYAYAYRLRTLDA